MYSKRSGKMIAGHYSGGDSRQMKDNSPSEFRWMDISVSVLGLTGIMMHEKNKKKKEKNTRKTKRVDSTSHSYSTEDEDGFPVKAVVSFFKHVNNTAIASHLPSLTIRPVPTSDSDDDGKNRFNATWPTDFDPLGNELSTFKCSRMMKIEDEGHGDMKQYRPSHTPLMIPERLQLTVGLTRGSEMLNVGSATVVVTGEEAQDVQVNIPISLTEKGSNSSKKSKKKAAKPIKPAVFDNDPQKKYQLNGNACLKLLLRVTPIEPKLKAPSAHVNAMMTADAVPEVMIVSSASSNDESMGHDSVSQYPPTFEPRPQHLGHQGNVNQRYPDYSYGTTHEERDYEVYGSNDDDTADDTLDDTVETFETFETSDTQSTLSRFTNSFTCAGIMCVPLSQNSARRRYGKNTLEGSGMLSALQRFQCNTSNHLSDIDDSPYRTSYRQAMSHNVSRKGSRSNSSKPSRSNYSKPQRVPRPRSADDYSVATEKVQNLTYNIHGKESYPVEELYDAQNEIDRYGKRVGIDPLQMI